MKLTNKQVEAARETILDYLSDEGYLGSIEAIDALCEAARAAYRAMKGEKK